MSCEYCEDVEKSGRGWIRTGKHNLFECPYCLQHYFCYNDYYRLWGKVNDELTWKFLVHSVDVPIALGSVCAVMPGYEEYAIDPVHKVCMDKVAWPTVKIEPAEGERKETEVIQWLGEYKQGNIFEYQFAFPIMASLERYKDNISSFLVPFVGQIKDWPNKDQQESIAKSFKDPEMEKHIVYLMSADYSQNYGDGSMGPISFMAGVVLLGDPNVGIIKPRYFHDPSMIGCVMEDFREKKLA